MSVETATHYQTLGVEPDASTEQVKRAYRRLLSKNHPDVAGQAGQDVTAEANIAFAVLADPAKRDEYDRSLLAPESTEEPIEEDVGDWGEETSWEEPTPAPEPGWTPQGTPDSPDIAIKRPIENLRRSTWGYLAALLVSIGLIALGDLSALGDLAAQAKLLVVLVSVPIGALYGWLRLRVPAARRPLTAWAFVTACFVIAVGMLQLLPFALHWALYVLAPGTFTALAVSQWVGTRQLQESCDSFASPEDLRTNNIFGDISGELTPLVESLLRDVPSARVVVIPRAPGQQLRYAVVVGDRAVFLGTCPNPVGTAPRWTRRGLVTRTSRSSNLLLVDGRWWARHRGLLREHGIDAESILTHQLSGGPTVATPRGLHILNDEHADAWIRSYLGAANLINQRLLVDVYALAHTPLF